MVCTSFDRHVRLVRALWSIFNYMDSKIKTGRVRLISFFISLIPCLMYTWSELKSDRFEYLNLEKYGIVTEVVSEYRSNWDSHYYYFYFITENGQKIEKQGKCPDATRFNEFYKNLKVIYDPLNPELFMEYPYFENYSFSYKVFFYLILLTIVLSLIGSGILTFIYVGLIKGEIKNIKLHNNRQ